MKKKREVKLTTLFSLSLLAAGLVTSVFLLQQKQSFTAKATLTCSQYIDFTSCEMVSGCDWTPYECNTLSISECNNLIYPYCRLWQDYVSCVNYSESECIAHNCFRRYSDPIIHTCTGSPPCPSGCGTTNVYTMCSISGGCNQSGCTYTPPRTAYCQGCPGLSMTNCNLNVEMGCIWHSAAPASCSGSYVSSQVCTGSYTEPSHFLFCSGEYLTGQHCDSDTQGGGYYRCIGTPIIPTPTTPPVSSPTPRPPTPTPRPPTPTPRPPTPTPTSAPNCYCVGKTKKTDSLCSSFNTKLNCETLILPNNGGCRWVCP